MYGRSNEYNRDAYATSNSNTSSYGTYNSGGGNRIERFGSYRVVDYNTDKISPGLVE